MCATPRRANAVRIASSTHSTAVGRTHDPLVVFSRHPWRIVEVYVLLIVGTDQIMKGMTLIAEYRMPVAFGVIEPFNK